MLPWRLSVIIFLFFLVPHVLILVSGEDKGTSVLFLTGCCVALSLLLLVWIMLSSHWRLLCNRCQAGSLEEHVYLGWPFVEGVCGGPWCLLIIHLSLEDTRLWFRLSLSECTFPGSQPSWAWYWQDSLSPTSLLCPRDPREHTLFASPSGGYSGRP